MSAIQILSGEVIDAGIESCENGRKEIKALLVRSVLDASPLPFPDSPKLFNRKIKIRFGF